MSWRVTCLAVLLALSWSCASDMTVKKGEPQTAREKMLAEERTKKEPQEPEPNPPGSKKWSGWRYQGDRKDCIYLVGRKCFKTEKAACRAAKCQAPSKCETEGAGPITMTCSGAPKRDEGDKAKGEKPKKK